MLTLSFIHKFAAKKNNNPKTMDRKTKAFTGKIPCSSPSTHRKRCGQKFRTKKLYTEEIMSESAVPNEVTRCVGNPKPNL